MSEELKAAELHKWICRYMVSLAEAGLLRVKPGEAEKVRRICARAAEEIDEEIFNLRRQEIEQRIKELKNA